MRFTNTDCDVILVDGIVSPLSWCVSCVEICDVIKQNESEVGQIQFSFFWLIVYIICKATLTTDPIEIGLLFQKYGQLKGYKNNRKQRHYLFCLAIS